MLTIISGGQTGVDRGAMDAGLAIGLPIGGWAPLGWIAEDGTIPERYRIHMRECPVAGYAERTRANVRDSDATLIVTAHTGRLTGGTRMTCDAIRELGRPAARLIIGLGVDEARDWLARRNIRTLNIAGPRESKSPGIQAETQAAITQLLEQS